MKIFEKLGKVYQFDAALGFSEASTLRKQVLAKDFSKFCNTSRHRIEPHQESALALSRLGSSIPEADYQLANASILEFWKRLEVILAGNNIIVIPGVPRQPPGFSSLKEEVLKSSRGLKFNHFMELANIANVPAIVMPIWKDSGSWPMSIQLLAARGNESLLLKAALEIVG